MSKFGDIEILTPSCNLTTIQDGRGGIFTWIPNEPLLEFNMLYFKLSVFLCISILFILILVF